MTTGLLIYGVVWLAVLAGGVLLYWHARAVPCPQCGSGRTECVADFGGVADHCCRRCGHWFQGPGESSRPGEGGRG